MKQSKHILGILATIWPALLLFSCAKDEGPFVNNTNTGNTITDTTIITIPEPTVYSYPISFGTDVKPIFPASCVMGCHNPQHPKLDLRPPVAYDQLLTDGASAPYVNVTDPKLSILYLHLVGIYTPMPLDNPKLPQGQIDTIFTWISQGALNN